VTEGVDSGSEMGTISVLHEDAAETVNDRGQSIGRYEGKDVGEDMGSSSGTMLLHDAKVGERDRESEVGMIEEIDAGSGLDSGTTFVHEDASEVV
jgi:hypothetical protein